MAEQAKRKARGSAGVEAVGQPAFGAAVEEVERILARLEAEQVDLDDLAREVRRAVELIGICRSKLAATETEVRAYVDALQAPEPAAPAGGGPPDPAGPPADGDATRLPF
ncbi:MAG: exodeoxyribonuclease VII small subunit [Candidatus Krumholzibacteriia bacterium]